MRGLRKSKNNQMAAPICNLADDMAFSNHFSRVNSFVRDTLYCSLHYDALCVINVPIFRCT